MGLPAATQLYDRFNNQFLITNDISQIKIRYTITINPIEMKKIIYIAFILLLGLASCEKILDKEPLYIVSDATVWDDPGMIRAYLVSLSTS